MPAGSGNSPNLTPWSVFHDRLEHLQSNRHEMDFGKGGPPNDKSIAIAGRFLETMQTALFLPTQVLPSVVGGVGVVMRSTKGKKKVYVEFTNKGSVSALFSDGVAKPVVEKIQPEVSAFLNLLEKAKVYLNA